MDALAEELVAVTAIFPECVAREGADPRTIKIHPLDARARNSPSLTLHIPPNYPQAPPTLATFVGITPSVAQGILQASWLPGEVCLYQLIESLRDSLSQNVTGDLGADTPQRISTETPSSAISSDEDDSGAKKYEFAMSSPIVDRKSVFVGRAIEVHSRAEALAAVFWLKEHDKKVARATHNIVAWRFMENGLLAKDNDDDGEDAAGARIAHLLEIMDLKNVMVIVSRWYGGVLLHGDRFKHISNAARGALEIGGFLSHKIENKGVKRNIRKPG